MRKNLSKLNLALVAGLVLGVLLALPVLAEEAVQPEPAGTAVPEQPAETTADTGGSCSAGNLSLLPEAPTPTGWDPATCGRCQGFCSSDNLCSGKLLGDPCNNGGGTCQAFTGCALFNCCRCANTGP